MTPAEVHVEVAAAAALLAGAVLETPLVPAPWLSAQTGADVRLKLENVQVTGSFKARGALHALLRLPAGVRARGVVTASSGNHGLGVARAAAALGCAALVLVPTTTPADKRAAIQALGAEVREHGADCVLTEAHARALAAQDGRTYVPPYNDPDVLAGQGTVAFELLQQWPEVERVYVAAGGGGLLAGMAGYASVAAPAVEWIGCSPSASPALDECVRQGRVVDVPCAPTWSDSTHGGVEPGAITVPLCAALVHDWQRVAEDEIATALRDCLRQQHLLVEGAAGVALAALQRDPAARGRRVCVVVCGGNLPWDALRRLVAAP
ncbi:MAG: pyridoxal-phosphate dependent enzyme [Planctomycetota bacterium]